MRLREELRQNLTGHLSDEKTEVDINIAAKIAEDFAISFAEWLLIEPEDDSMENCTTKELLEIFKKENQ
jgi:hypothetical protein